MTMSRSLEKQMKLIADKSLKIAKAPNCNAVLFKSQMGDQDEFCLYYEFLTELEILEVTKILAEVYSSFSKETPRIRSASADIRELNRNSGFSGRFVGIVIDLEASALHKLLLLTSGNRLLSKESFDLVVTLAQTKKEARFYPEEMSTNSSVYSYLKNLYILPGVSVRTVIPTGESLEMNVASKSSIATTSRLMAFLANDFKDRTLREHLQLDLTEVFTTQKSLADFSKINLIREILLLSDYRELAESMTAKELSSLSYILDYETSRGQFSKHILRNRSEAMEQDIRPITRFGLDSIVRYLSKDEQKSLSSLTFVQNMDGLVNGNDARIQSAPIVYAALAEVFSVKGERAALEVARSLEHLRISKKRSLKMYEATVAIIAEALIPENDDLPFAWSAQLSDHAWVLTSHLSKKFSESLAIEFL